MSDPPWADTSSAPEPPPLGEEVDAPDLWREGSVYAWRRQTVTISATPQLTIHVVQLKQRHTTNERLTPMLAGKEIHLKQGDCSIVIRDSVAAILLHQTLHNIGIKSE